MTEKPSRKPTEVIPADLADSDAKSQDATSGSPRIDDSQSLASGELLQFRVVAPVVIVLMLLIAAFVYRAQRIAGIPDPGDPFANLEGSIAATVPVAENAFGDYERAMQAFTEPSPLARKAMPAAIEGGWGNADDHVRAWVESNRDALEVWQAGTRKERFRFHDSETKLSRDEFFDRLFELSQAGCLEASRLIANNELEETWDWQRAVFRCSRHCGRNGLLDDRLTGARMHELATNAVLRWSANSQVSADQLDAAIEQLQRDDRRTPEFAHVLREEYEWSARQLDESESSADDSRRSGVGPVVLFFLHEPEFSRRTMGHIFANWNEHLSRPLYERGRLKMTIYRLYDAKDASEASPPAESITNWLDEAVLVHSNLPSISAADDVLLTERSRQGMLLVSLAVQHGFREQGRFPEHAEELLKGSLRQMPADPFGDADETIRYRREGDAAIVWSVYFDREDDGGVADDEYGTSEDLVTRISPPH